MTVSGPIDDYRQAAKDKFDWLCKNYDSSFWRLGHAFDTMIDYLDNVDPSGAADLGEIVLRQYQTSLNKVGGPPPEKPVGYDAAWFDDFGWWTIAFERGARKMTFFSQDLKTQFLSLMSACWSRFDGNAPYVWDRQEPGSFTEYEPAVDGGVWNAYWTGTSDNFPGPRADPRQAAYGPGGIQNTVTNTVYLISAQRLGQFMPGVERAYLRQYDFLSTWLWSQEPALWWVHADSKSALVRERVSHFANRDQALGFQPNWSWTGDQGLILGVLTDRMISDKENYPRLLGYAKQLLEGARSQLAVGGILQPWSTTGRVLSGFEDDYRTGVAVFWRYLLHAWKTNDDLRAVLTDPAYRKFVKDNADRAKDAGAAGGDPFNTTTNDLAVLIAATVILEKA